MRLLTSHIQFAVTISLDVQSAQLTGYVCAQRPLELLNRLVRASPRRALGPQAVALRLLAEPTQSFSHQQNGSCLGMSGFSLPPRFADGDFPSEMAHNKVRGSLVSSMMEVVDLA